jgi:hypothetical protein
LSLRTVLTKVGVDLRNTTSHTTGDETSDEIHVNVDRQELLELEAFISNLQSVGEGSQGASSVNAVVGAGSTATLGSEEAVVVQTHKKRKNFTNDPPYFDNDTSTPDTLSTNGYMKDQPLRKKKKKRKRTY